MAGKRLLIKQINKLPSHAGSYFCCSLCWGQGDSVNGWGTPAELKVGAMVACAGPHLAPACSKTPWTRETRFQGGEPQRPLLTALLWKGNLLPV